MRISQLARGSREMLCPICGALAAPEAPAAAPTLIDCPKHGRFIIAAPANARFLKLDIAGKELAYQRAKLFADRRHGEVIITKLDL